MVIPKIWATPAYGTQSEADSVTKELGLPKARRAGAKPHKYQNLKIYFFDKLYLFMYILILKIFHNFISINLKSIMRNSFVRTEIIAALVFNYF